MAVRCREASGSKMTADSGAELLGPEWPMLGQGIWVALPYPGGASSQHSDRDRRYDLCHSMGPLGTWVVVFSPNKGQGSVMSQWPENRSRTSVGELRFRTLGYSGFTWCSEQAPPIPQSKGPGRGHQPGRSIPSARLASPPARSRHGFFVFG